MVAGAAPDLTLRGPAYEWALWSTTVRVAVANPHHLPAVRRLVDRELAAVEQASSRFRADSELRRLAHRGGRPTRVSAVFLELLDAALALAVLRDLAAGAPARPRVGERRREMVAAGVALGCFLAVAAAAGYRLAGMDVEPSTGPRVRVSPPGQGGPETPEPASAASPGWPRRPVG